MYSKFLQKNFIAWYAHMRLRVSRVNILVFLEYFACVLNECSLNRKVRLYNDENVVGMSVSVH